MVNANNWRCANILSADQRYPVTRVENLHGGSCLETVAEKPDLPNEILVLRYKKKHVHRFTTFDTDDIALELAVKDTKNPKSARNTNFLFL